MLNGDVSILADNYPGTDEATKDVAKVYVMLDTVAD